MGVSRIVFGGNASEAWLRAAPATPAGEKAATAEEVVGSVLMVRQAVAVEYWH